MKNDYTEEQIAEMARKALTDPQRREELLNLLDELGLLPKKQA